MAPEVVPYQPRFRRQLVDLRRRVFGGTRRFNEAYFRWKYERNPYLPEPLFSIAVEGDRVIGMRGFYGARWSARDTSASLLIPVAADTAVDPDHRGRWLPQRMMTFARDDLAERGYEYVFNFSGNDATRVLSLRAGWRSLAAYQTLVIDRTEAAAGWRKRVDRRLRRQLGLRSPAFASLDRLSSDLADGVIVARDERPAAMADLVRRQRSPRLSQLRDRAYYAWRFQDPHAVYRFLFIGDELRLEAFFVLQQGPRGGIVGIVDWCAEHAAVRTRLLQALLRSGIDQIQIWSATLPLELDEELRAAGFREEAQNTSAGRGSPGMLIAATGRGLAETWSLEGQPLLDPKQWDLRMLDSDAY